MGASPSGAVQRPAPTAPVPNCCSGAPRIESGRACSRHDPAENQYEFVGDAPTTMVAFALVGEVFRPVFGDRWWADVVAVPRFDAAA